MRLGRADPKRIVVIDDDLSVRKALRRLLRAAGFEVETFGSAEEFLRDGRPDKAGCLVLDLYMPGTSGLELQRRLLAGGCDLPVVFISAHDNDQARAQALASGALGFLRKPFQDSELLDLIGAALGLRGAG